jgi:hypothetical protein
MTKIAQLKKTILVLTGLATFIFSGCNKETQKKEAGMINDFISLQSKLQDPPSEYRSAPLWDWNDKITEEGIDYHMKKFKEGGLGGVFVHPRPGLITEYISEDWHHLFDYTVQKGKELGMKVWIYDENSYPSGFAGGHVPAEMPDSYSHGTGLGWKIQDTLKTDTSKYEVVLKLENYQYTDITSKLEQEQGKTGKFYLFSKTYSKKGYWMGNFPYVDLLYKGVTEKFLEITMKGYEKYNKADFGNTLPGIFTDEPNLEAALESRKSYRWTPDLYDEFQKRWGYDLKVNLPSLVDETGNWKKVRHDYYTVLLEMFIDRWAKPWNKYCEVNNLAWTGHYWEHGWPKPTDGMDESAFYLYHQMPGVDMLGNTYSQGGQGDQFGNTRAIRELHSAANQAGHNRMLSETYGGAGWEINFTNYKRLVDWQVVLGVNFVNQHLSYFTIKGVRKFDYPPSFTYHEPWWENYKPFGDYLGRISMAMSSGEQINKTVVLQPNTTAWSYFSRKNSNPFIDSIQVKFKSFVYQLERAHYEYDLGSELVMKTIGSVKNGKLVIGKRSYGLVVIPAYMENLEQNSYTLLKQYLLEGGKILSFTRSIPRLDGAESNLNNELMTAFSKQWTFAESATDEKTRVAMTDPDFSISESLPLTGELYHQRRILKDGQILFFVNSDTTQSVTATITGNGKSLFIMNLNTGKSKPEPVKSENGVVTFDIELPPAGSALYYLPDTNASSIAAASVASSPDAVSENNTFMEIPVTEKTETTVSQGADNVLVLDFLDLKSKTLDLKNTYFMKAMRQLYDSSGFKMGNPWQHKIQYRQDYMALDTFKTGSGFEVSYHFRVAASADLAALSNLDIVVERPELWDLYLNGTKLSKSDKWWIDREFFRFPVGSNLKQGSNLITLKAEKMSVHAEIMPAYLVGNFKLNPLWQGFEVTNGTLSALGSWKAQGFPFYSQKALYTQKYTTLQSGKSYKVKLNRWNGTMAAVYVNGEKAGVIMAPPFELELPSKLTPGDNVIGVEVIGSLKNTFGFFYKTAANRWIIGPGDWDVSPPALPSPENYFLLDYGLFEPFSLVTLN